MSGSIAKRYGDRQQKLDGLKKWPLRLLVKNHDTLNLTLHLRALVIHVVGQHFLRGYDYRSYRARCRLLSHVAVAGTWLYDCLSRRRDQKIPYDHFYHSYTLLH